MGALKILKLTVLWSVAIVFVAAVGYWLLPERYAPLPFLAPWVRSNFLLWSWANFDGEHYLSIAKYGYQIRNGFPQYAFFPLFPLLIKLFSLVFRDYLLSGLLVTHIALFLSLYWLEGWLKQLRRDAKLFLPTVLLWPGAIFLAAVYTEPLFLALAAGVFYYSERKRWGTAVFLTALATATRVNGVFLVLFLFVKLLQSRLPKLLSAFYLILSTSGFLAYMAFIYSKTGDPLAWLHAQVAWGKATATSPLATLGNYLQSVTIQFHPDLTHAVVVLEVATTIWALYLLFMAIRRRLLSLPYYLYLAGNLALPIGTGSLGSMPRFFLTLFPLGIVITTLSRPVHAVIYTTYIALLLFGLVLFTRGYWFA